MGHATDYLRGLTSERLWWLLRYDPWSGRFYRNVHDKKGRAVRDGSEAGSLKKHGYRVISVDNQMYLAHRLAWFYMTNEWPAADVDHRNNVRDDNRWDNLRAATRSDNLANMRVRRDGLKGVYMQANGRWTARIRRHDAVRCLGTFDSEDAAHQAYRVAADGTNGEFARFA